MGVVADVQAYLAAQGLVDGATAWKSQRRRVSDVQDQLVVITEDGGAEPPVGAASGVGEQSSEDPAVQVRVRAAAWDGDTAFAKAQAIKAALHGKLGASINGTTYMRVVAMTPEPTFMGYDDKDRPEFTISFRMKKLQ